MSNKEFQSSVRSGQELPTSTFGRPRKHSAGTDGRPPSCLHRRGHGVHGGVLEAPRTARAWQGCLRLDASLLPRSLALHQVCVLFSPTLASFGRSAALPGLPALWAAAGESVRTVVSSVWGAGWPLPLRVGGSTSLVSNQPPNFRNCVRSSVVLRVEDTSTASLTQGRLA